MAGALSTLQPQQQSVDPGMPNYGAVQDPYGSYGPYGGFGSMYGPAVGGESEPDDYAKKLYQQSEELSGVGGEEGDSPLARLKALKAQRDAAAQAKLQSIRRAMSILSAAGQKGPVNLPLLAYSNGLLSGGMTPGAAMGVAGDQEQKAIEAQRALDYAHAGDQAQLEQNAGSIPWEQAKAEEGAFDTQQRLGEQYAQAAARADYGRQMAEARKYAADASGRSRLGVADINARAKIDAANTAAQARQVKELQLAYAYMARDGVDFDTAMGMVKGGVNDPQTFQKDVAAEKGNLMKSPDIQALPADQVEALAEQNVLARAKKDPLSQAERDYNYYAGIGGGTVVNADGTPADKKRWIANRARQYASSLSPYSEGSPGQQGARPSQPAAPSPLPPINQRVAGKTMWKGPKGTYLWSGRGWDLVRPTGQ